MIDASKEGTWTLNIQIKITFIGDNRKGGIKGTA